MKQALALKYRPRQFDSLVGQDVVRNSLSHALESANLGHAYLFSGLRGSGKTSSARIFAKALICERGISAHPCDSCDNCAAANEGRHLDIVELDAASNRGIENIKELIEQTKYAPSMARFKIFIIDEAHMLTTQASNAFLKTLEEPPAYVKFILATTDPLKLPPTILSRTQHFRFKSIARSSVAAHLSSVLTSENVPFEARALEVLARAGGGSMRDTLTLLDQAIVFSGGNVTQNAVSDMLGLLDPARIEEIFSCVVEGDLVALLKSLEDSDTGIVIGEMIESAKAKLLSGDSPFSTLVLERFFKILSNAQKMLSEGADGEFVLYLSVFAMREAMKLFDVATAVGEANLNLSSSERFQNQTRVPTSPAFSPVVPVSHTSPVSPVSPVLQAPETTPPPPQKRDYAAVYAAFVNKLYDRSTKLGECFDNHLRFVEFDGQNLLLEYDKTDETSAFLQENGKFLRECLGEFFAPKAKFKLTQSERKSDFAKFVEEKSSERVLAGEQNRNDFEHFATRFSQKKIQESKSVANVAGVSDVSENLGAPSVPKFEFSTKSSVSGGFGGVGVGGFDDFSDQTSSFVPNVESDFLPNEFYDSTGENSNFENFGENTGFEASQTPVLNSSNETANFSNSNFATNSSPNEIASFANSTNSNFGFSETANFSSERESSQTPKAPNVFKFAATKTLTPQEQKLEKLEIFFGKPQIFSV